MAYLPSPPTNTPMYQKDGTMSGLWKSWFATLYNVTGATINYAPTTSKYILQNSDSNLPNSQNLSALTTGMAWVNHNTGAISTRTITGTSAQIQVTNGDGSSANPVISIASNYPGQGSISQLGVVTTGTWNSDIIDEVFGGTGNRVNFSANDIYSYSFHGGV